MYKGKFDQKSRQNTVAVEELLAQRQVNAQKRPAAPKAAPTEKAAAQTPAKKPSAPQKKAAPVKKGPRLGSVIFYTLYFLFILLFFLATFLGLQWVNNWLINYEAAQPTYKADQVFSQLFTNPDWEGLYVASGAQDSPFEGRQQFVDYMNSKVDPAKLSYLETSNGLSKDKKFVVRMDNQRIATFTLTDRNAGDKNLTAVPDWVLGDVEVFFQRQGTYRIEKLNSQTAYLNGVELSEDYTIQEATTLAEDYLPAGVQAVALTTQEVNGVMATPEVEVFDAEGNPVAVSYNEETHTFSVGAESNSISVEEKAAALGAAETNCKWMIKAVTDRATVGQYFDSQSSAYSNIVKTTELWMQSYNGFEFVEESVTDYVRYSADCFSARVSLTLNVTRTDGTVKGYPYAQSLFFRKMDSGKWLCFAATNVDVSQPVGRIRLTFMDGDTKLVSDFFQTDAKQIITPILPAREGQVFTGWVRKDVAENGQTTLTVVFQPDETGTVSIPEGTNLSPMTLYALFENADAAAAAGEGA